MVLDHSVQSPWRFQTVAFLFFGREQMKRKLYSLLKYLCVFSNLILSFKKTYGENCVILSLLSCLRGLLLLFSLFLSAWFVLVCLCPVFPVLCLCEACVGFLTPCLTDLISAHILCSVLAGTCASSWNVFGAFLSPPGWVDKGLCHEQLLVKITFLSLSPGVM